MNDLSDQTGETIHLAVPSATEVVYIAKVEGKHTLGMFSHIGARLPMYCTALGKAILAFSGEKLLVSVISENLLPRTQFSITSAEQLKKNSLLRGNEVMPSMTKKTNWVSVALEPLSSISPAPPLQPSAFRHRNNAWIGIAAKSWERW